MQLTRNLGMGGNLLGNLGSLAIFCPLDAPVEAEERLKDRHLVFVGHVVLPPPGRFPLITSVTRMFSFEFVQKECVAQAIVNPMPRIQTVFRGQQT